MRTQDKPILVTGADGFVGGAILDCLRKESLPCIAHTRAMCDLFDGRALSECYSRDSFRAIVHAAARIPRDNREDLQAFLRDNLLATENVLALLERTEYFLYLSTLDVYGPPLFLPITEAHPTEPISNYALTKLAAEKMIQWRCRAAGIPCCILRLTHVYGPADHPIKLIPKVINLVINGETPEIIGDGTDLRDYLHVRDAARAVAAAIKRSAKGTINVATGKSITVVETVQTIIAASGSSATPIFGPRASPRMDFQFDVHHLKESLGFHPQEDFVKAIHELCAYQGTRAR